MKKTPMNKKDGAKAKISGAFEKPVPVSTANKKVQKPKDAPPGKC